jgi:Ca2+-binding RTX toxin-like protein
MSRLLRTQLAPSRRRTRLALAAIVPAAAVAAALPGAAQAATLQMTGSTIQYQAAAGETNGLRIAKDATGATVLHDVVPITETSANCNNIDANRVRCVNGATLHATLGNMNDNVFTEIAFPITVDAGSGDDLYLGGFAQGASDVRYFGNTGRDTADYRNATAGVTVTKNGGASDGRPGDRDNISSDVENLVGSRFNDTLEGSNTLQFERYDGLAGDDTIKGGGGPDIFEAGTAPDGADKIFGGTDGSGDTMTYEKRSVRVEVSSNLFDNDDGQAGERDTVREMETLIGGTAGDKLAVSGASTTPMTLIGGRGGDQLSGSAVKDLLIGQQGADLVFANGGDDTIGAVDGELDRLFCGDGVDTANRDLREQEVISCESGVLQ